MNRTRLLAALILIACLIVFWRLEVNRRDMGRLSHTASGRAASATICAVGDVLLDRGVAKQIAKHGFEYPFANVSDIVRSADIAFANLECPIANNGSPASKRITFRAKPETVACLKSAGLDVLSLANNHSLDYGPAGLDETMTALRTNGIACCGVGHNRSEAERASILESNGVRIAFVGFSQFISESALRRNDMTTIAYASEETVARSVQAAKKQADIVVASFHWGEEYSPRPTEMQVRLAHRAVDSGADLIVGHHPHVLQGLEVVKRRDYGRNRPALIAYSLGNFVFDPWSAESARSMILRCAVTKAGVRSAEVIPVEIQNCQPSLAEPTRDERILARIRQLSAELGTAMAGAQIRVTD